VFSQNQPAILRTMSQHVILCRVSNFHSIFVLNAAVSRETADDIEISSVTEECPSCGTVLAQSLTKWSTELKPMQPLPKLQTAYDLLRFSFGIEKLDSVMRLGSAGSLCIVGHRANLILTRLCVRALLPARFGGLD